MPYLREVEMILPSQCRSKGPEMSGCEVSWETGTFYSDELHPPESQDRESDRATPTGKFEN